VPLGNVILRGRVFLTPSFEIEVEEQKSSLRSQKNEKKRDEKMTLRDLDTRLVRVW
jgi:hypothetical protein